MSKLIYYVYAYLRCKTTSTASIGQPYYKGKGKRAYEKHKGVTLPKDRSKIVFLETNLSELGSLAIERRMIKWYGRKDLGTGILLNRTDGGEGVSGHIKTQQLRDKISSRNIGTGNGMHGKNHSTESKAKISAGHLGIKLTQEHKDAVGNAHRGTTLTEEHKAKCSEKLSGKNNPNHGKKITDDQKAKFRITRAETVKHKQLVVWFLSITVKF